MSSGCTYPHSLVTGCFHGLVSQKDQPDPVVYTTHVVILYYYVNPAHPWNRPRAGGQKGIILYRLGESDSPAIVQSILYRNLHTPHKQPYPYLACQHTCPQSLRMPSSGSSRCCQG